MAQDELELGVLFGSGLPLQVPKSDQRVVLFGVISHGQGRGVSRGGVRESFDFLCICLYFSTFFPIDVLINAPNRALGNKF